MKILGDDRTEKWKKNTPGTAGVPGGRDRTLAVKNKKIARKSALFLGEKKLPKKHLSCAK